MKPQINIKNLDKEFLVDKKPILVLKQINFQVIEGDFVIIYGPSGCGKSTLLNIISGWEPPTRGNIYYNNQDIYTKTEDQRAKLRQAEISLIHQSANWVKSLNVIDNITIPSLLAGKDKTTARKRATLFLELLHLEQYYKYKPMDLSGGQQQRISLIRALMNNPQIIMADEPTGNLDTVSSKLVMELLHEINTTYCRTIIMVTHNMDLLSFGNKNIKIVDGKITDIDEKKQYHTKRDFHQDIVNLKLDGNLKKDLDEETERRMSKI